LAAQRMVEFSIGRKRAGSNAFYNTMLYTGSSLALNRSIVQVNPETGEETAMLE